MESKKRLRKIFLSLTLGLIGLTTAYAVYIFQEAQVLKKYATFLSKNPMLDFTFKYPADWKASETQGRSERYDAVYLNGPRDDDREFSIGISITVVPADGQSDSALLPEYLETTARFNNFELLSQKSRAIGGQKTSSATYQHTMRLPIDHVDATDVLIKGDTFFLRRGDRNYRVTFRGTAEQFDEYLPVFERMLKTFRFRN